MDKNNTRLEQIVALVDELGYVSVAHLSQTLYTSEITIRRDLKELAQQKRVRRMHGGAASMIRPARLPGAEMHEGEHPEQPLLDRLDVVVTSDLLPRFSGMLKRHNGKKKIPIVAESLPLPGTETCVRIDDYQAGFDLGVWAGRYAGEHWEGRARVLDLTYHRPNTQARSQGFLAGLRSVLPEAELTLSINTQSRYDMSYQLTRDALAVHPDLNIIFAINDVTAQGAYDAVNGLGLPHGQLIILPMGIEGETMKELLMQREWIAAGVCMFPEVVAMVCVEAAIACYNQERLPEQLTTPHCVITSVGLPDIYRKTPSGWKLQWQRVLANLRLPLPVNPLHPRKDRPLPARLGFIYTFVEHEWYKSLLDTIKRYTADLGIVAEVVDFEQTLKDEIHQRRVEIARLAAAEVREGDTILIDAGPISGELAEHLTHHKNITVVTNSMPALEILKESSNEVTLISSGGAYRRSSQAFVGPTAESTLKEFRIDKLFLMVSSVSKNLSLYHTNISEVTIKQLMIRSAREVILLADYNCFQQEALVQVAPIAAVNKLITDDALPASVRLELGACGVTVILASNV